MFCCLCRRRQKRSSSYHSYREQEGRLHLWRFGTTCFFSVTSIFYARVLLSPDCAVCSIRIAHETLPAQGHLPHHLHSGWYVPYQQLWWLDLLTVITRRYTNLLSYGLPLSCPQYAPPQASAVRVHPDKRQTNHLGSLLEKRLSCSPRSSSCRERCVYLLVG